MKFNQKSVYAVVLAAASVFAAGSASAAMSSIADSWHNLGSGNSKGVTPNDGYPTTGTVANKSAETAEICVFCHTPHGGDNTAAVPIWNRKLNDPAVYLRYSSLGTTTFDAEEVPIGSVTIACLSCHDGTMAIDSLINAPGSGRYDPAGKTLGATGTSMTGTDVDAIGSLREGIVQNLGTDLTNDHPVSMQYAGGGITTTSTVTRDPDFTGANGAANPAGHTLKSMPAPSTSSLGTLWWVERNADSLNNGGRDREDVILYTRDRGAGAGPEPFVECGSCHDPHNIENPTFLRVSNSGPMVDYPNANGGPSGLCLTCHMK